MENGRENLKNTGVMDKIIERDTIEYPNFLLDEVVYGENRIIFAIFPYSYPVSEKTLETMSE